jgi:hypothetical protein
VSLSGRAFMVSQEESRKRLGDQKAILFMSASTTWTRGGLMPTDTTGINPHVKSLLLHIPSFTFPHFILATCAPLLSLYSILLGLAIGCKTYFGMRISH